MRVLLLDDPAPSDLDLLRALLPESIELLVSPANQWPDPGIHLGNVEAIIGGSAPPGLIDAAPDLRFWVVPFAGIPSALRQALEPHQRMVVCNSHFNASDVAEQAWALLLAAAKRLIVCDRKLRQGDWSPRYEPPSSIALRGATLLLVGYGAIGRALVPLARGFGMSVLALKRTPGGAAEVDRVVTAEGLHELLPLADVVIASLPATRETEGFLGRGEFERMKSGVILVNVGRGSSVDEGALFDALRSGRVGAAGIDTWWVYPSGSDAVTQTPPSRFPFAELDNVVLSPHRASHVAGRERARMESLAEVLRSIAEGRALNRVDRERWY